MNGASLYRLNEMSAPFTKGKSKKDKAMAKMNPIKGNYIIIIKTL